MVRIDFVMCYKIAPKKKDPKKMKKEKELTFSVKTRQKHKHMTTVCGLELFGVIWRRELKSRCGYKGGNKGIWQEVLMRSFF